MFSTILSRILISLGTLAGLFVAAGLFIYFATPVIYANRIMPGTKLLDLNLGGKTLDEAREIIGRQVGSANFAPLKLTFEDKSWDLIPKEFGFKANDQGLAAKLYQAGREGSVGQKFFERSLAMLGFAQTPLPDLDLYQFDKKRLTDHLTSIAKEIDGPSREPKLTIQSNRVTDFIAPQDGRTLDIDETSSLIARQLLNPKREITLPVSIIKPKKSLSDTNKLGINELLGHGESNFTGSPKNRRHNISTGANRFDGMIVAAGQTFSFVQNLGEVDAASGYLPELVIKGDKTTPEFGGGLCQVSSTAFRGLLNAGLPIVERRNHSYRVAYYEPAGTDATIYEPSPDLKFKNDTPGSILIDTYIQGNYLYFDFYGTNTGRRVEMEGPFISNVTPLADPIYVDTSTLPPGQTKQVETAHRGADAVLYRKVYQGDKVIYDDTFKSHYIPWPAKFLRGVAEAPAVPTDLNNVPTDPVPATTT